MTASARRYTLQGMSATDGGVLKYSVVLCTLQGFGQHLAADANVWEHPHEVLETVAAAGYDAVDLDAEPDRITHERFEEVRAIAHSLGLQVPALLGAWGRGHAGEARDLGSADEAQRAYAVSYAKKCVELSARVGRPVFEIAAVPGLNEEYMQPTTLLHEARANFRRSVTELVAHAERHGVPVAIEALNRFEGYQGLGYQGFMNSLAEAMELVDEIDSPCLGVLADCFHVNIEDKSMVDALHQSRRQAAARALGGQHALRARHRPHRLSAGHPHAEEHRLPGLPGRRLRSASARLEKLAEPLHRVHETDGARAHAPAVTGTAYAAA